ncbi:protein-glutamate O-methyltransferase CheR [Acidovorax sp.]|uniref:CheR family methyltransferase n=1 Tax=Acidovorax sp. TaxID=1872122 RepID=UPI00262934D9|nr:protein-glutamate O-methyltransferase CheR [Acidovorax sp.]
MVERIEQLLKMLIGLDVDAIGRSALERALRERLAASQLDPAGYWDLLERSTAEQQALIEAVVVPETWFFRYPEAFALLVERARALRAARGAQQPLRILSLPCSTGEEPYSIAICLLDAGFAPSELHVDAFDVSLRALDIAAVARYGANAFRSADLGFRERHFRAEDRSHLLLDPARSLVNFRSGNLLDVGLALEAQSYDFVFCRNLLIYFDRETQLRALARLERWMAPEGLLFVGPAEAGMIRQQGMLAVDRAHSFAFNKRREMAVAPPPAQRPADRPVAAVRPPVRVAAAAVRRAPVPAEKVATALPDPAAQTGLAQIERLANTGRVAEALAACAQQLQRFGPSASLFYWWGLLCDSDHRAAEAERYYRKALYLEPHHPEALAHLAALQAARGDQAGALRLKQRLTPSPRGRHANR